MASFRSDIMSRATCDSPIMNTSSFVLILYAEYSIRKGVVGAGLANLSANFAHL
jgi:hypothetical protein